MHEILLEKDAAEKQRLAHRTLSPEVLVRVCRITIYESTMKAFKRST